MRRFLVCLRGVLQLALAVVLLMLGLSLPATDEVNHSFTAAHRVTADARGQLRLLKCQVEDLRRPELRQFAGQVQKQARTLSTLLKNQHVDFDTVCIMRDSLGDAADGLDGLAGALDPQAVGRIGDGLGETASFLEDKVVPAAERTADQLDRSADALQADSRRLGELLRTGPVELQAVHDLHDSLGRFGEGLEAVSSLLKAERLETLRRGFRGMEVAFGTGADQVGKLGDYEYPIVEFEWFRPRLASRPLWFEGRRIAAGMREAATGATAAGSDLDQVAADLPKVRAAVEETRRAVAQTRTALGVVLEQHDQLGELFKDAPGHAARLAADLPRLGKDLARTLRDSGRLRDAAKALRQAQQGVNTVVARWPQVRAALTRSARLLRATRGQMQQAVDHREEYEAALQQSAALAESFSELLPWAADDFDGRLASEHTSLADLDRSMQSVEESLPASGRTAAAVVFWGRWLAWLGAAVVGLHGVQLLYGGLVSTSRQKPGIPSQAAR